MILLVYLVSMAMGQPPSCKDKSDCDTDMYCDREAYHCKRCVNCAEYGRISHSSCAKSVNDDCGDCLPGYIPNLINVLKCDNDKSVMKDSSWLWLWISSGVLLLILLAFGIYLIKNRRKPFPWSCAARSEPNWSQRLEQGKPINEHNNNQPPPPYFSPFVESLNPSAPDMEQSNGGTSYKIRRNDKITVVNGKANASTPPNYVRVPRTTEYVDPIEEPMPNNIAEDIILPLISSDRLDAVDAPLHNNNMSVVPNRRAAEDLPQEDASSRYTSEEPNLQAVSGGTSVTIIQNFHSVNSNVMSNDNTRNNINIAPGHSQAINLTRLRQND